jgi:hypothetical protein
MNQDVHEIYRTTLRNLKLELAAGKGRLRRPGVHNGLTPERVDAALERLDRGSFGYCRGCYLLIPHAELLRRPYEDRCPLCRESRDRRAAPAPAQSAARL